MLAINQLWHTYGGTEEDKELPALEGIDLDVYEGEFLCLIGPSGSGKSTLLDLISGFIRPTQGFIHLDGNLINQPGPDRGVVFQEPNLFPWLTVVENVSFGLHCQGTPKQRSLRIAKEMLSLVGLADFADFRPHELSGGMKQRVSIARVLALDPKVMLMDEPFGALDAQTRRRLQDELLAIWRLKKKTIIFVTHNVEEAIYLADRVAVFCPRPGRIKAHINIDLPRPRQADTIPFVTYKERLTNLIDFTEELV